MRVLTGQDIYTFIKSQPILKDWSDEQIMEAIFESLNSRLLAYSVDSDSNLDSICLARWYDYCSLHIIAISGFRGSLRQMIHHLRVKFPEVKYLTAFRSGKFVRYNVAKNLW
jgi:hypothetical protein